MARFYSKDDLKPRIAAGYGQGQGASYRPWLGITDVPSQGTATRVTRRHTGRIHVFFSSIELGAFLASEWLDRVIDVREQFPLIDMDEVEAIAAEIGVRLPTFGKSGAAIVPTTDFLLTVRDPVRGQCLEVIAVKPQKKLLSSRVLELLEIERLYFVRKGVPWSLVTEAELPKPLIDNLLWVSRYYHPEALEVNTAEIERTERIVFDFVASNPATGLALGHACAEVDDRLGLRAGLALSVVRHAVARKWWLANLQVRIDALAPPPAFTRNDLRITRDLRSYVSGDVS
ncbi:TnsA endonuclease N-terminal domain-containing protein [Azospirillum soli]|uniref:TnsA endonuclease N-terminal domain-containing protein n=1 Tax=Azospirillum soli TaxID=1304799 RepID=UPI001AE1E6A0|nr:TnsA endonuclease N-terminal domain-containing protein [Azospirillum soli]MBP2316933.1 hypothetical protein [Azospirillum soli]